MRGIVGTAGHIDHGKTALIGALTGEHTDRLPEEQRRGISIDLGFTHLDTRHGVLGVIDVPGHEDFIRNMLAGATGIDVLLLVVAADEGVMPQTREHVAIAELLGVHRAVVAVSKADLVSDEWLALVRDELTEFLTHSPFAAAPMVATSATTGMGLPEVRAAIEDAFDGTRGRPDDLFRMPVDRTFTVRGTGTVVTGTVWSGRLERDADVRLLPGGLESRVRELQVHGGEVEAVEAGQRAAIALAGTDRGAIERGMAVVAGPGWVESSRVTVSLRVLPGTRWRIEPWQRLRVHLGTAEVMARAVLLEAERLDPGDQGLIQLRLEAPLLTRAGDRFVVRSYSPVTTIGGGIVAEPFAPKRARLDAGDRALLGALLAGEPDSAVRALLVAAGGAGVERVALSLATGATPDEVGRALQEGSALQVGSRVFDESAAAAVREQLLDRLDRHHATVPLQPGVDPVVLRREGAGAADELVEHVLDELLDGTLIMRRGRVARPEFRIRLTPEQEGRRERIHQAIAGAGVAAPRLDDVRDALGRPDDFHDLVALLEDDGRLVRVAHDLFIDADALDEAVARLRQELAGRTGLAPGDFRDVLDVSRRHLIPLLEYMDSTGITVRDGEGRSLGT